MVRISAKPIFVFQALVQYLETHRVLAPGYSFLQDVVSRALGKERGRLRSLLDARLDEATRKMLDKLYLERDAGYAVTALTEWELKTGTYCAYCPSCCKDDLS